MKFYQKKRKRRRMSGKTKWAAMLLVLFVAGTIVEGVRMEWSQSTVTVTAPFRPQYSANDHPQSSVDLVAAITGIDVFQKRYDTSGVGQKIALIDSGVDLSHEAFATNIDGTSKVD